MLGLRPDMRLVVAERLLQMSDGPTLKYALQGFHESELRLPDSRTDRSGELYVTHRWARFEAANPG